MNKQEFLAKLRAGLHYLPQDDMEERLTFYSEMIDDRMEDGLSEEDAVSEIGNIDALISQILADVPQTKLVKENIIPKKRLKAWEIVLLVLGSPIWLSLMIAAFAVMLSLYVVLWTVLVSLWAVFVSLICCTIACIVLGFYTSFSGDILQGLAIIGAGLVCGGLSVFMFYGCKAATKGVLILTGKSVLWIKSRFIKKEENKNE